MSPSRPSRRRWGPFFAWLAGLAGAGFLAWGVVVLLSQDPFAPFEDTTPQTGLTFAKLHLRLYELDQKVASAFAERVEVSRDRSLMQLFGVREGEFINAEGTRFGFEAVRARYFPFTGLLQAEEGARVWGDDMDLRVAAFDFDSKQEVLSIPGAIEGRLGSGNVTAQGLRYTVVDQRFAFGPVVWVGQVDAPVGDQRKAWTVSFNGESEFVGDVLRGQNGTATDGEVLLKADVIEHNRRTDVLTATGNVRYFGQEANMRCEKAVVYRTDRRAVLTGNVSMLIKPESQKGLAEVEVPVFTYTDPETLEPVGLAADPAGQGLDDEVRNEESLRQYPTQVRCDEVEYWYAASQERAIIRGRPQARQELPEGRWRWVWANQGLYDGVAETLRLVSREGERDARMRNSLGDDIRAVWFEMSTKEGEDRMKARDATGVVQVDEKRVEQEETGGGDSPPPPRA